MQEYLVKVNHGIPLDFPPEVLAEAAELDESGPSDPDAPPDASRRDLRHLPFVTIDGEDARDFDDAIHVRALSGDPGRPESPGWELHVAIADVSHFVRPNSALDREARQRANSCYFPASVAPMLPEALSNGLCSLRPGEDRLVLAARLRFDAQGHPRCADFFPGVIRSRARLTYTQAQALLEAPVRSEPPDLEHLPDADDLCWLHDAEALARQLRQRRLERGALDFDLPEPDYAVDRASSRLVAIRRRQRLFAHRLIEEFMLAANEAVARFLRDRDLPFPYRVHPVPDQERLDSLFLFLRSSGLPYAPPRATRRKKSVSCPAPPQDPDLPNPAPDLSRASPLHRALVQALTAAEGTPLAFPVNRQMLRAMMQARYSPDNEGHFGLASACYCHFTSPIRRYADLLTHRALRMALGLDESVRGQRRRKPTSGHKLLAICDQCNRRERVAIDAEREIMRRLACVFLRDRVGEVFGGVISAVLPFGFFVELEELPVEGLVALSSLNGWLEYDRERQELVGPSRRFRLGDPVSVRLAAVQPERLAIDLVLVDDSGDPGHDDPAVRGRGKKIRKRKKS